VLVQGRARQNTTSSKAASSKQQDVRPRAPLTITVPTGVEDHEAKRAEGEEDEGEGGAGKKERGGEELSLQDLEVGAAEEPHYPHHPRQPQHLRPPRAPAVADAIMGMHACHVAYIVD